MLTREDLLAIGELMDGKLEPIRQDLSEVKDRMGRMEVRMDHMEERMDRFEVRMDRLEGRMDRLEGRMDGLESRMDGLESRMDGLESRMDGLESRMDSLESDVSEIKRRVVRTEVVIENEVDRAIKVLAEGHEGIVEKIDRDLPTKEELENDEIRIFAVEETVKLHTVQIGDLQTKIS